MNNHSLITCTRNLVYYDYLKNLPGKSDADESSDKEKRPTPAFDDRSMRHSTSNEVHNTQTTEPIEATSNQDRANIVKSEPEDLLNRYLSPNLSTTISEHWSSDEEISEEWLDSDC